MEHIEYFPAPAQPIISIFFISYREQIRQNHNYDTNNIRYQISQL